MRVFGFMIKKDLKPTLVITLLLVAFSLLMQFINYKKFVKYEPYYSEAFEIISKEENFSEAVSTEISQINSESENAFTEAMTFMYAGGNFFSEPPKELPDDLVERLIFPDYSKGKFSPKATTDRSILVQMNNQAVSQQSYLTLISDQIRSYERNMRRGIKDAYVLAVSDKLYDDYNEVIKEPVSELVDTRHSDAMVVFFSKDMLPVFAVFIMLFSRFSSEIQSRRFMSFTATKYGCLNFTVSKIFSGYVNFLIFYVFYCASVFMMYFIMGGDALALSAPIQTVQGYELSPESLSVFSYMLTAMGTRLVYCIALGSIIMMCSFVCKRTIPAGIAGLVVVAMPIIVSQTYEQNEVVVTKAFGKIILSCDIFNMYHGINYINIAQSPVKIYWLFLIVFALVTLIFSLATLLFSGKRGVGVV